MRFKAKLVSEQISLLYSLIGPVSRLVSESTNAAGSIRKNQIGSSFLNSQVGGGGSVLYLDSDHLRICTKGKSNDSDGISCFTELKMRDGIFLEHRIESVAENNVILMELDLAQLRAALQSIVSSNEKDDSHHIHHASSASSSFAHHSRTNDDTSATFGNIQYRVTVLKLAKRNGIPCLCLDAHAAPGGVIEVHHAIPVRIMRSTEAQYHLPPEISMPDVQLEFPPERPLRTVVERLRSISPQVYLEASMVGELTIRIDTEGASIRTFFNKLIPRLDVDTNNPANSSTNRKCTIKVDTKKLCASMQWQQPSMLSQLSTALLCLIENEMLVIHVMLNPSSVGFFTYYIPVHILSDDDILADANDDHGSDDSDDDINVNAGTRAMMQEMQ